MEAREYYKSQYLAFLTTAKIKSAEEISEFIERGVNNITFTRAVVNNIPTYWDDKDFMDIYHCVNFELLINMDPESSINIKFPKNTYEKGSYLLNKISEMSPESCQEIAGWSSADLNPEVNRSIREEQNERRQQKVEEKESTAYTCKRCKGKRTHFRKVQTRSLDEGYTIIFTCLEPGCGYDWRINS